MAQKALLITKTPEYTEGLDALNDALAAGWRVVHSTPMGAAGAGRPATAELHFAALVVIEQSDEMEAAGAATVAEPVEEAEDEVDDLIGEIVEGDGAGAEPELSSPEDEPD